MTTPPESPSQPRDRRGFTLNFMSDVELASEMQGLPTEHGRLAWTLLVYGSALRSLDDQHLDRGLVLLRIWQELESRQVDRESALVLAFRLTLQEESDEALLEAVESILDLMNRPRIRHRLPMRPGDGYGRRSLVGVVDLPPILLPTTLTHQSEDRGEWRRRASRPRSAVRARQLGLPIR